jgi:hypothetical protein
MEREAARVRAHGGNRASRGTRAFSDFQEESKEVVRDAGPNPHRRGRPTPDSVIERAERMKYSAHGCLEIFHDAQVAAGLSPRVEFSGKEYALVGRINRAMEGVGTELLLAHLGMRWPSFLEHLIAKHGWPREKLEYQDPYLGLAVNQMGALVEWFLDEIERDAEEGESR